MRQLGNVVLNVKNGPFPKGSFVYIGRKKGTICHFGNPFIIGRDGDRREVVRKFEAWLKGTDFQNVELRRRKWVLKNLYTLRGMDLLGFCAPLLCHGNVYLKVLKKGGIVNV